MSAALQDDVVFVHTSDLHLSADPVLGPSSFDSLGVLRAVLAAATAARAHLVILAGDTFDHNRQPPELVERAAEMMDDFGAPIVILPGNHDPLTLDSVYRHAAFETARNVSILGLKVEEAAAFPRLEVEVRGRAHRDYFDMSPLPKFASPSLRWRIVAAHGHFVEEPEGPGRLLGSWLIRRAELVATGADYVALGHWNRAARVGDGQIQAYYSGSPEYAGTVNVVRLRSKGAAEVTRLPLHGLGTQAEAG
jgi:DNA repair exonuclease SbcCD nuclease subunit